MNFQCSFRKATPLFPLLLWILSGTANAETIEPCDSWKNRLKSEHHLIKNRENELLLKIERDHEEYKAGSIDRHIDKHHQEIKLHNQKLTAFKRNCSSAPPVRSMTQLRGYFIQVGAFKIRKYAATLQKQLKKRGTNSQLVTKKHLFAIWVGPFNDMEEANRNKSTLLSKYDIGSDSYIIHLK